MCSAQELQCLTSQRLARIAIVSTQLNLMLRQWALSVMASTSISVAYSKLGSARKRGSHDGQSSIS
jgi:hypothetical protein